MPDHRIPSRFVPGDLRKGLVRRQQRSLEMFIAGNGVNRPVPVQHCQFKEQPADAAQITVKSGDDILLSRFQQSGYIGMTGFFPTVGLPVGQHFFPVYQEFVLVVGTDLNQSLL
ncbi:hypothetical protein SDC9_104841 [bioreactor metagenome]|uniref:Uncharacterized protein n=1 Tax=bioreactor metagenome TaxID=1076179 RepID=A0A645AXM2_9ZZZZ